MEKIKILVADASSVYRQMFVSAAEALGNIAVYCVTDGREAQENIRYHAYAAAVIDAEIPGVNVRELMRDISRIRGQKPVVIIVARPSFASEAFYDEMLALGAYDCVTKPLNKNYAENFETMIRGLSNIMDYLKKTPTQASPPAPQKFLADIVLIASSTGGPSALGKILAQLDGDFPVPILIVQHMPLHFIDSMADSLNLKCRLNVKIACHGEEAQAGTVYIAPGKSHMKLGPKKKIAIEVSAPVNGVQPSADVLFDSAAESFNGAVLAVVLTGMGRDGAAGVARLKEKLNCYCIAQSERTCVVYGMPRSVAESGLADAALDLEDIPAAMTKLCAGKNSAP
ncbi:MAG: response regulator [Clostridiales bacterium]|jgi:two-component system chemotaxis response regulator CheB|nr:response regulator [Clostridiales bacterium]